jgi:hypothetical protein
MNPPRKQTVETLRERLRVARWRRPSGDEPGDPGVADREEALIVALEARVAEQEDAARRSAEVARRVARQGEIADWLEHFLQGTEHRTR